MNIKNVVKSIAAATLAMGFVSTTAAKDFVQDAEYYVLEAQHGEKWAAEDKSLNKKLAELEQEEAEKQLARLVRKVGQDRAIQLLELAVKVKPKAAIDALTKLG